MNGVGPPDRARPDGIPTALLVVAKAPAVGRVKTRMCPPLELDQAAVLASAALLDTMDTVEECVHHVSLAPLLVLTGDLHSAVDGAEIAGRTVSCGTVAPKWRVIGQRGRTFGERLHHAHLDGGAGRATLQIGMDTPQVTATLLSASVSSLANPGIDAVLGPTVDGGWWALGLSPGLSAAFLADVPMSTSTTGLLTRQAMERAGLRVAILPTLTDVDTIADGQFVADQIPSSRFARAFESMMPNRATRGNRR